MLASAGMLSLSVNYPRRVVTNADIRSRAPAVVAETERKTMARLWAGQRKSDEELGIWAAMMEPHLRDPFRGTIERRHLAPGESSLSLELVAAREAIMRCGLEPRDIDLVIGTSFLPDQIGVGNATFVCKHLGLRAAAWNLESACSGTLVAFQTACALVQAGKFEKILVVTSCAYSRYSDPEDTFGWFLGDGAAAFVVGEVPAGEGLLAQASRNTAEICGTFRYDLDVDAGGTPRILIRADDSAGRALAEHQDGYVRSMTQEALARAASVSTISVSSSSTRQRHGFTATSRRCWASTSSGPSRAIRSWPTRDRCSCLPTCTSRPRAGGSRAATSCSCSPSAACRRRRPRSCGGETSPSGPIRSRVCERLTCFTTEKAP
jgi:3-oxoacyl-[acyl-carrier-protein] synthase-3